MLSALNFGPAVMAPSRTNGFLNMLETMRKRTVMLTEHLPKFPSLHITGNAIIPQGSFAEAQAKYLAPDAGQVDALVQVTTLLYLLGFWSMLYAGFPSSKVGCLHMSEIN